MENNDSYINHPTFYIAVDCVVFGYDNDGLKLLLYPRRFKPSKGDWSLMGGFVQDNESLEEAARRVLKLTVGLENIFLEQVGGYSDPSRDPGARVISMSFYALIRINEHDKTLVDKHGGMWCPVITKIQPLVFDHNKMVQDALVKLQKKASYNLIGKELLPEYFTLTQLNNLYNAIFQRNFDAGNFRKKLASLKVLKKMSTKETDTSKRGAFYYKFKDKSNSAEQERIVKI